MKFSDPENPVMWFVRSGTSNDGFQLEERYIDPAEATAKIAEMRKEAEEKEAKRQKWLAENPKPWNDAQEHLVFLHCLDKNRIELFMAQEWCEDCEPMKPVVYRLNTLPEDSANMREEIETKVNRFGECEIVWTCTGHTRTQWQSEAAAEQLRNMHPNWEVTVENGTVKIVGKGGGGMSLEKQETIADIVEEMRNFQNLPQAKQQVSGKFVAGVLAGLAGRIEKAWGRARIHATNSRPEL